MMDKINVQNLKQRGMIGCSHSRPATDCYCFGLERVNSDEMICCFSNELDAITIAIARILLGEQWSWDVWDDAIQMGATKEDLAEAAIINFGGTKFESVASGWVEFACD